MSELAQKKCTPCSGDAKPMDADAIKRRMEGLDGWESVDDHHIRKTFDFQDFMSALDFVNRVGQLAEQEGHHPWLHLTYGKVIVESYTHKIDGLHDNDFILAAKVDELPRG